MSVEKKAAHGVAWNMAFGVVTRIVGLIGTLALTHFIAPAEYGEVSAAVVCVLTANNFAMFAVGQYIIAHASPPRIVFQAGLIHFVLGALAMLAVFSLRHSLGSFLDAPELGRFIPGYALAIVLDRARHMPERLLVRDLRFRTIAMINSLGELVYVATSLSLATRLGGYALMAGAMARSTVTFVAFVTRVSPREWLVPAKPELAVAKGIFSYGAPVMFGSLCDRAASSWDNLVILRLFGAKVMGAYALSYSLADTPLTYVAERMGDVLMPAFSKMTPEERPAAVTRAAGLMSLVVAPLGVGLGAVAPTIVTAFFDARWSGMASMLAVLSVMTIIQPAPWSAVAYLQAERKTRPIAVGSVTRVIVLLGSVIGLGYAGGPVWACAGVGIGFGVYSVQMVVLTARVTKLAGRDYFISTARPLLATVPMFLAVTGLRYLMAGLPVALTLTAEIVVGAVVYVAFTFVLARKNVQELLQIVRRSPA